MNKSMPKSDIGINKESNSLTESEVRDFLIKNPSFFLKHPDLLIQINIPDNRKGSVSLIEIQNKQLQQKLTQASSSLSQLIKLAEENQHLYTVFTELSMQLLDVTSLKQTENIVSQILKDKLGLSCAIITPFVGENAFPEIQQRLLIEKRFKNGHYFFGRLSDNEKQLVFKNQVAESSAIILLGPSSKRLAMLAVGSKDGAHFTPDMDTLLLEQLRIFLNSAVLSCLSDGNVE